MKKLVITLISIFTLIFTYKYVYYNTSFLDSIVPEKEVKYSTRTNGKDIEINKDGEFEKFEIRGVNLGSGYPGKWSTDYAIDKETYLRWFKDIQDMGANCIRIYTINSPTFYNALYEFNSDNENPLYLIQGVNIDEHIQNSRLDAFNPKYINPILEQSKNTVDIIHGNARLAYNKSGKRVNYTKDISKWVLGYIIGSEWRESTVVYTDKKNDHIKPYKGSYIEGTLDTTPFESMIIMIQDKMIAYESKRYKEQRLMSFCNWNVTDPFDYPKVVTGDNTKTAKIDIEHMKCTNKFKSGLFASYHLYASYPDYYEFERNGNTYSYNKGLNNSYNKYLNKLNSYHKVPVVIAEYGVSTGRGITVKDVYSGRTQGHLNEQMQGEAIISCYDDIKKSGCSGSILFSWQDEWDKKTANTLYAVNELKTPYWSDRQTDDQFFGLLSFDPGNTRCVCYVDGDDEEWDNNDIVYGCDEFNISAKYDEQNIYFKVYKKDFDPQSDTIYIPIDTTQKSGSNYCDGLNLKFDRACDFLVIIDGEESSQILVQERYNSLDAMYSHEIYHRDAYSNPPSKSSPVFTEIDSLLKTKIDPLENIWGQEEYAKTFPAGILEYGNGNPNDDNFDSLADFYFGKDIIEIKIPWALLNFSNPSEMMIHDDYYENYGVEEIQIDKIYVGLNIDGDDKVIKSGMFNLKGWGNKVSFHERLKESYYIIKDYWNSH